MKHLSRWGSRHTTLAIGLIIVCEVINGYTGVLLGASLLDEVPVAVLQVGVVGILGGVAGIRRLAQTGGSFGFGRRCVFGAFLGNFLLFGLLGGSIAPRHQPDAMPFNAWGSLRLENRSDTLVRPDTLRPAQPPVTVTNSGKSDKQIGKRIGFVLLFFLGIFLAYLTTGLACTIACSGQGFAAIIVFFLGLGFPAGGVYFLGRLSEQPIKKLSDMTPAERRRAGRRFWLTWVVLIGLFLLVSLVGAAS